MIWHRGAVIVVKEPQIRIAIFEIDVDGTGVSNRSHGHSPCDDRTRAPWLNLPAGCRVDGAAILHTIEQRLALRIRGGNGVGNDLAFDQRRIRIWPRTEVIAVAKGG